MTKEQIEARKAELQAGLEQLKANMHATNGAIQECNYWLSQLALEEMKPVEVPQE